MQQTQCEPLHALMTSRAESWAELSAKESIATGSQAVIFLIRIGEATLRFDDLIPLKANTIKVGKERARLPVASCKDLIQS